MNLRRGPTFAWTQVSRASLAPINRGLRIEALALLLVVLLVGCAAQNPPAVNTPAAIDLTMAKSLLVAQTAIEQSKPLVVTHPAFKDQLNQVIAGYNLAETAYLGYHQALLAGSNPDPTAIQAMVTGIMTKAQALIASIK